MEYYEILLQHQTWVVFFSETGHECFHTLHCKQVHVQRQPLQNRTCSGLIIERPD